MSKSQRAHTLSAQRGVRVHSLDYPTQHMGSRHDSETGVRDFNGRGRAVNGGDDSGGSGASATDAAIAVSQLPVLGHFREGLGRVFAIIAIVVNFAALVGLLYYFRTSCTSEYGVLPNESGGLVPPSLANLADQGGVTIISRSLVYYQANSTYYQGGLNFWTPFQPTCGCSECNLASCAATIPIVVEYEQCHPWAEVLALSAGLIVYVNVAFTALFAVILGVIPCSKKGGATRSTFWDFVVSVADG